MNLLNKKKLELIEALAIHRERINVMTHAEYQAFKAARAARHALDAVDELESQS